MFRLALYQPDMAPNVGAMMRLCACLGARMEIIEPCGFVFDDRKLKRAGMDYIGQVELVRHGSWEAFLKQVGAARIVLLTTKAEESLYDFAFRTDDILLMGRESAGVPDDAHCRADARIKIPMQGDARSLNIGMAAAMAMAEAIRQTDAFAPA
ncbi:MAG: tRNA (cytidine(34)-2'-O)-methyltransferase [Bdellovibrionales bacterium]